VINSLPADNETHLIFCRDDVDPEVVTRILQLSPTESLRVGDEAHYPWNGQRFVSNVGLWKLRLPPAGPGADWRVEDQLARWVEFLQPESGALRELTELDYRPYLDCKAEARSLSLCIDPEVLTALGALSIALSVWLYEFPKADAQTLEPS
jgi:hypothetical protein